MEHYVKPVLSPFRVTMLTASACCPGGAIVCGMAGKRDDAPRCSIHGIPLICLGCQGEAARKRAVQKKGANWRKARARKAARARWAKAKKGTARGVTEKL